jgi:hypothetical protein
MESIAPCELDSVTFLLLAYPVTEIPPTIAFLWQMTKWAGPEDSVVIRGVRINVSNNEETPLLQYGTLVLLFLVFSPFLSSLTCLLASCLFLLLLSKPILAKLVLWRGRVRSDPFTRPWLASPRPGSPFRATRT